MLHVKELRKKLDMTQREFANHFEIPLQNVQHWEQGFRNPPEYVEKLINKLAVYEFGAKLKDD